MDLDLEDRSVLVTGSYRGTGLVIARSFLEAGANVFVHGFDVDQASAAVAEIGGGKIVVADGEILALVELPLLGLLSEEPTETVTAKFDKAFDAIRELGCDLASPFSQLEFSFACGEIGDLRLSDEGLLRVDPPEMVSLVVD